MNQTVYTFENLPKMVGSLIKEISDLKDLITQNQVKPVAQATEQFLTFNQTTDFLGYKASTLYSKVSKREIPSIKRGGKLYFSLSELTEYLKQGKQKTFAEMEAEANSYLSNNKKGLQYEQ